MASAYEAENSSNWMPQARARLALRRAEKPATKAGQVRALWPDIEAALAIGQSVKSICKWLEEDAGINLGVTSLTSYISRIRRRETANRNPVASAGQFVRCQTVPILSSPATGCEAPKPPDDPLAPAMRALSKPKIDIRKIHNDGDPQGRNLI